MMFRLRPGPGSTEFKMGTEYQAYLKKAAEESDIAQIRSYSDGTEGDHAVEEVTRKRAEVIKSLLEQ